MKNKLIFLVLTLMALASPIWAQDQAAAGNRGHDFHEAAAFLTVGIASGLCGLGQGKATASAAEAIARNPGAIAGIRFVFIFGLVLIESLGLYALVVTFIAK